jgi:lipopolysaccharide transport system permease protein
MSRTTSDTARGLQPAGVRSGTSQAIEVSEAVTQFSKLPSHPLVTIQPGKAWSALNLREVWAYRELLYFLTWRDVKVRYKQTLLGVAWAIIQPLFTMIIFSLFFGRLAGIQELTGGIPYPLFAFAGLIPWTFFSNAVTNSGNSLVGSANLITKVYFPRMIVPGAAVAAGLVDLAVAFVMLGALMIYYRVALSWNLLMIPYLVLLTTVFAVAVGMWMSALNVKYRDIRFALPFMVQLWMFVSPVIYPTNMLPVKFRGLLALNPLTGIIEGFRSSLFGLPFDWRALIIATVLTIASLVYAAYSFRRVERYFADIV